MAEPSKSPNWPDGGAPAPSGPHDGARTLHERELPVSAIDADHSHRTSAAPQSAESRDTSNRRADESANGDGDDSEALTEDQVKLALRRVKDPDRPVDLVDDHVPEVRGESRPYSPSRRRRRRGPAG